MVEFTPIKGVVYKYDYPAIFRSIAAGEIEAVPTYRELCRNDLFFLLYFGLERTDVNDPFIIECIREVERDHVDTVDLWAREHYKSTIITYALPIQEIINNPEERIGIFSHTRPIAKGFLRQIKQTLENKEVPVVKWFPDIFWRTPRTQAPKWSEDDGITVRRKSNSKEASIEAWGMVDGQPTSKHFTVRIYDDVVTKESVTTPDQIQKVLDAYETSESLGTDGGTARIAGTHYHFADLYAHLRKQRIYKVRIKPATHDGTPQGRPVLLSQKRLNELRQKQGPYIFACQQLLNPVASEEQKFKPEWVRYYDILPAIRNKYLLGDPANEKRKQNDYTTLGVISVDPYGNWFLEDAVRQKLSLGERWEALRNMWLDNQPIQAVGYEKYGKDADINYFEEKQKDEGTYFMITPLGGNQLSKGDRILRLVPRFKNGTFYLPRRLIRDGEDLVQVFIDEEYVFFPFVIHDDLLDMMSRMEDIGPVRPADSPAGPRKAKTTDVMARLRGHA